MVLVATSFPDKSRKNNNTSAVLVVDGFDNA